MIEYLDKQQLAQLQALTSELRDWLLITTQYETGCTVSELVNIKKEDIQKDAIRIDERLCKVSQNLLNKLLAYINTHNSPYVFPSRQQESLSTKRVQQIIKKHLKVLDVQKPTPHVLRYTHIAHAVQQSIPLHAIKAQTGLGELRLSQIVSEVHLPDEDAYTRLFS